MSGTEYPANVKKFMEWYEKNPICRRPQQAGTEPGVKEDSHDPAIKKAKELGLAIIMEKSDNATVGVVGRFIIFDPKVPEVAFEVRPGQKEAKPLSAAQKKQFDESYKELAALIADHDLSEPDLQRIASLRKTLQAAGGVITLVNKGDEAYIGLTMAGNAKYAHATLTKVASK